MAPRSKLVIALFLFACVLAIPTPSRPAFASMRALALAPDSTGTDTIPVVLPPDAVEPESIHQGDWILLHDVSNGGAVPSDLYPEMKRTYKSPPRVHRFAAQTFRRGFPHPS